MTIFARVRSVLGGLLGFVLVASIMTFIAAPEAQAAVPTVQDNPPGGVTSDILPTAQINGVVWDQVIVNNIVYAGGEFTSARPAGAALGTNESPRYNLMSYNITTGVMTSWAPVVNGDVRVLAASPDGSRIYIGGSFTSVNGQNRYRVAAFNTSDGSLVSNFAPVAGSDVFALAATNSVVYLGGWFTSMNNVARSSLAAVSATDGSLLAWAPTTNDTVRGMGLTNAQDRVIIAGNFSTVNGASQNSVASLDATTGASYAFAAGQQLSDIGTTASMLSMKVVNDQAFSTGYTYGVGNFEGVVVMDAYTGAIQNMLDCHGDTYDSVPMNGLVYSVSHHHFCTNVGGFPEITPRRHYHSDAFTLAPQGTVATNIQSGSGYGNWAGQPVGAMVDWWNVWTPGGYTSANQAGWTVETSGDYLAIGGEFTAINGQAQQGLVRFGDRNVVAHPSVGPAGLKSETVPKLVSVGGTTIKGNFTASYDRDSATLTYKVIRSDLGEQNPVATLTADSTPWIRPTLSFTDNNVIPGWTYTYYVIATDKDGNSKTCDSSTVTAATSIDRYASAVAGDGPSHYWRLDQASGTTAADSAGTAPLTLQAGVTSGATGALVGNSDTASTFNGTSTGSAGTTVSENGPQTFSEEVWFKTTTSSGGKLIGFGSSSTGLSGSYDRHIYMNNAGKLTFGVYPSAVKALTTASTYRDGNWHYVVGTLSSNGMKLYVDGTLQASDATTTSAQSYTGYWRLGGDSTSGWTNNGSSNYFAGTLDEAAVYPTELSATQVAAHYNAGRTAVTNTPPTASFTATTADLTATLDATGSSDPDGSIVAYGWEFGDGSRATGATATHTYALSGTYTVKLTVVDNLGASKTASKAVTISVDNQGGTLIAKDTFNRSQTRWGNAAIGGAWTDSGSTYYSVNGSMGVITLAKAGVGPSAQLNSVSATDQTITTDVALDKVPTGSVYLHQLLARVNGTTAYKLILRFETNGGIKLYITKLVSGTETTLQTYTNTTFGYTAGQRLNLRFDVHGTSPTTLAGKVWVAGTTEPGAATVRTTDSTAELQTPGAVGITSYTSASMTSLPLTVTVDQYLDSVYVDDNQPPVVDFSATPTGTSVAFDASATTDSDGTIASYAWDFGDGTTGTGKTPTHNYAASGTYAVALTATDDDGAASTYTKQVTVVKPNLPPTAVIANPVISHLEVDVDGRASSDADGTVDNYQWDFGDGEGGEGAIQSHTYDAAGTYTITLTVTDDQGAQATATRTVTVATNIAPTGVIAVTKSNLTVSVDGSGSSDPDGTIASYAWDYGDGSTGSGKTDSHTYAAAGTYVISLTVTDNDGAATTVTQSVTIASANQVALDTFTRTTSSGWGTADKGGVWTVSPAANFSTDGANGVIKEAAGGTRQANLNSVSAKDVSILTDFTLDKAPVAGNYYHQLLARVVNSTTYYSLTARAESTGIMRVYVSKVDSGTETILKTTVLSGFNYASGEKIKVRFDVSGTGTTTLSGKVWRSTDTEPATPTVTTTDTTTSLQAAGAVGLKAYAGTGMTSVPLTITIADFAVTAPQAANVPPTASFTATPTNLIVAVDGSASSDSDGTVTSYAWDFGDGATGTGKTASHTYAAAGTYTIKLTVTDDGGATASTTQNVTVSAPTTNQPPTASFTTTPTYLTVAVDGSASSDSDGTVTSYAWDFGDGATGTGKTASHTYSSAGTYTIKLTVTDDGGLTNSTTHSVTVAANQPPTASFTATPTDLKVDLDASASSDPDGTIASYAWDFGDGATGTGKTASHTYSSADTYTVKLTVTDDGGATASTTKAVTVTVTTYAKDAFNRTTSSGWGTADTGGAWTVNSAANFSTDGANGVVKVAAGATRQASLNSVSAKDVSLVTDFSLDQAPAGGNYYHQVLARVVGSSTYYSLTARAESTGIMRVYISKMISGTETVLKTTVLSGFNYVAGEKIKVRFDVSGTGTTTLSGKVWRSSDSEPSAATVSTTDTTAELQAAGAVSIKFYAGSTMTSVPLTVKVDDFSVKQA